MRTNNKIKVKIFIVAMASLALASQALSVSAQVNYTVQPGDTLYRIARDNKVTVAEVKLWNGLSSDIIYVGQVLKLQGTSVTPPVISGQYTVVSGDTLGKIALKYGVTVGQLKTWNNLSSDIIYVGQFLKIQGTNVTPPVISGQHTVVSGDTLGKIALKYGVTVGQLKAWNNLSSDIIYVGQFLKIQGTNVTPPVTNGQYTVVTGDTLGKIALKYGVTVRQLRQWNHLSSDIIFIGQKLVVTAPQISQPTPRQTYKVQKGDTLYKIAKSFGVSVQQLYTWNNLTNNIIFVGNILYVGP